MLRPTPRSTLFPYTTLFRSDARAISRHNCPDLIGAEPERFFHRVGHGGITLGGRQVSRRRAGARTQKDRKSTRLNSSHQIISYAVFCLKKKKKNENKRE